MQVDTVLYNAKVYTSKGIVKAGIAINDGRIVKVAKEPNLPKASVKLNLNGCLVLPGLIDSHVHLRDQQLAYKEDFLSGTSAAAAGGVTTVIDMPNNKPVTMNVQSLRTRIKLAEERIVVNVAFNSAFPETTKEIREIVHEDAVGFKLYLLQQIGGINIDDEKALQQAFKTVAELMVPIAVHAEDKTIIEEAMEKMRQKKQEDLDAFLEVHPIAAEVEAISRVVRLARRSGAHVHVCHVSSEAGLTRLLKAKNEGLNITCEVTPHHLLLTRQALKKFGNLALETPPLRTKRDVNALWQALEKSSIDTIASDHAPHSIEEKQASSVWDVKLGIAGLETTLPLMLTQMNKGRLTIPQLVHLTCEKPAEIFRLSDRGRLIKDCSADVVVVDLNREHKIDASRFNSKAKFSPFDGLKVKGMPVKTFVNGQLVMDEGEIVAKPRAGQILR